MLIQEALKKTTKNIPDKTALKFKDLSYSYLTISKKSNQIARGLKKLGVERGNRVLIYLPNCTEVILGLYGIIKADAIFVIINTDTKFDKLKYIINNCGAKYLITTSTVFKSEKEIKILIDEIPTLKNIIFKDNNYTNFPSISDFYNLDSDDFKYQNIDIDIAGLIYTSGSTGFPKGVMMTHLNIMSASNSIIKYLRNTPDDIILDILPLSFDYGLYQVFMCFTFGGTLILHDNMVYYYQVIQLLNKDNISGFPGVPTVFSLLMKMKNIEKYLLPNLRYITNTGAVFPVSLINKIRKIWPHIQIYSMYGLTECKRVSYLEPEEIDVRPDSVGKAMPNQEVFIVDEKGNNLGANQVGELVIRGASVMQGYWADPTATNERIKQGRYPLERLLYSGDLFKMNNEGYLYFIGRKDELLKIKGERVFPKEIENILYQLSFVQEAAVIGVPDEIWGNYVKAFIVLKDQNKIPAKDKIILFCRKKLESYAVPKEVVFIKNLPKSIHGKIDKNQLE
jgi:amino acid adenylation domain-containing protein